MQAIKQGFIIALTLLLIEQKAQGTFEVTTDGSFQDAITAANGDGGDFAIGFSTDAAIDVAGGSSLTNTNQVTIGNPGIPIATLQGTGGNFTLLTLLSNANLILQNLIIRNFPGGSGGALDLNNGTHVITGYIDRPVTFSNNNNNVGGALRLPANATATFNSGTYNYENNTAVGAGGALRIGESTLTINDGVYNFTGNSAVIGGAIAVDINATLNINNSNCVFENNSTTTQRGGAISAENNGHITIDGGSCSFQNNTANTAGGAIALNNSSTLTVENGTFTFNENTAPGNSGGAISVAANSNATFNGGSYTFTQNGASSGGAIHTSDGTLEFNDGTFLFNANTVSNNGGAISIAQDSSATFNNGSYTFTQNEAINNGGAIHATDSPLEFNDGNYIFNNNSVNILGGAIFCDSSITFNGGTYTFTHNTANVRGGAIRSTLHPLTLSNSTFVFEANTALLSGGAISSADNITTLNGGSYTFIHNYAPRGGAITVENASLIFNGGSYTFTNNYASGRGGAIYLAPSGGNNQEVHFNTAQNIVFNPGPNPDAHSGNNDIASVNTNQSAFVTFRKSNTNTLILNTINPFWNGHTNVEGGMMIIGGAPANTDAVWGNTELDTAVNDSMRGDISVSNAAFGGFGTSYAQNASFDANSTLLVGLAANRDEAAPILNLDSPMGGAGVLTITPGAKIAILANSTYAQEEKTYTITKQREIANNEEFILDAPMSIQREYTLEHLPEEIRLTVTPLAVVDPTIKFRAFFAPNSLLSLIGAALDAGISSGLVIPGSDGATILDQLINFSPEQRTLAFQTLAHRNQLQNMMIASVPTSISLQNIHSQQQGFQVNQALIRNFQGTAFESETIAIKQRYAQLLSFQKQHHHHLTSGLTLKSFDTVKRTHHSIHGITRTESAPTSFHHQVGRYAVWIQGTGQSVHHSPYRDLVGFSARAQGASAGLNYTYSRTTLLGITAGATRTAYDIRHHPDKGNIYSANLGFFGVYQPQNIGINVEGALLLGHHRHKGKRFIFLNPIRQANQRHRSMDMTATARLGHGFQLPNAYILEPYISGLYKLAHAQGYQEKGAGAANLHVRSKNRRFLEWGVGTTFSRTWRTSHMLVRPNLNVGLVQKRALGNSSKTEARLVGLTNFFTLTGDTRIRNFLHIEANVSAAMINQDMLYAIGYRGQFNGRDRSHGVLLKATWRL